MLLGFDHIAHQLVTAVQQDRLPQVTMVVGPKGIGKATFAKHWANFLLDYYTGNKKIEKEKIFSHFQSRLQAKIDINSVIEQKLDLLVIAPDSQVTSQQITISQIRNGCNFLLHYSRQSEIRILIIDAVDDLNHHSTNALLKTLEESSLQAKVILICHQKDKALPTLLSRSYIYQARKLSPNQALGLFEHKLKIKDSKERQIIYELAAGSLGQAKLILKAGGVEAFHQIIELINYAAQNNLTPIYQFLQRTEDNASLRQAFPYFLSKALNLLLTYDYHTEAANTLLDKKKYTIAEEVLLEFYDRLVTTTRQIEEFNCEFKQALLYFFCGA